MCGADGRVLHGEVWMERGKLRHGSIRGDTRDRVCVPGTVRVRTAASPSLPSLVISVYRLLDPLKSASSQQLPWGLGSAGFRLEAPHVPWMLSTPLPHGCVPTGLVTSRTRSPPPSGSGCSMPGD